MLGARDDLARAVPAIKSEQRLRILVGAIDKVGIALAGRPVIHSGHKVVAEAVYVIFAQPVLVELEKIITRKLLGEVRSGPSREELARENAHHRIGLAGRVIDQVIRELGMRMGIDGVEQDRDATLMTSVNEALHPSWAAKAIIGCKIAEWRVSPLDIFLHVGDRHELQHIYAEPLQIVELVYHSLKVVVEFTDVQLIHDHLIYLGYAEACIRP